MLSVMTGFTVGPRRFGKVGECQSMGIKIVGTSKLLHMGKGQVTQLGVPSEPNFLKRGEVLVGIMENIVEG